MTELTAPKVKKITVLKDMLIRLEGEGIDKIIDISDSDLPDRYPDLKNEDYFKKASLSGGAISWPKGLHVDLYELVNDWPDAKSYTQKIAGHYSSL